MNERFLAFLQELAPGVFLVTTWYGKGNKTQKVFHTQDEAVAWLEKNHYSLFDLLENDEIWVFEKPSKPRNTRSERVKAGLKLLERRKS